MMTEAIVEVIKMILLDTILIILAFGTISWIGQNWKTIRGIWKEYKKIQKGKPKQTRVRILGKYTGIGIKKGKLVRIYTGKKVWGQDD